MEEEPKRPKLTGQVHVYTGPGKGKTTVALGIALRAMGHGYNVCIIQFLKGGEYTGEYLISQKLPRLDVFQFGVKCPWAEDLKKGILKCGSCRYCFGIHKDDRKRSRSGLKCAKGLARTGEYDVIILDEINVAMDKKLIETSDVLDMIEHKKKGVEIILTGRGAPEEIKKRADLVTEMKMIKHPMYGGEEGRIGIDY